MELSDEGTTQLKGGGRGGGRGCKGGGASCADSEEEQKEIKRRGDFKGEAARNSRLGCCGVSVSRTDCLCIRENPFVPNQFSPYWS